MTLTVKRGKGGFQEGIKVREEGGLLYTLTQGFGGGKKWRNGYSYGPGQSTGNVRNTRQCGKDSTWKAAARI